MVSRRALAPVAASGEATKPGLAPNGSLNQQPPARQKGAEGGLRDVSFIQEIRSEHEWLLEAGVEILGCLCHWIAWG